MASPAKSRPTPPRAVSIAAPSQTGSSSFSLSFDAKTETIHEDRATWNSSHHQSNMQSPSSPSGKCNISWEDEDECLGQTPATVAASIFRKAKSCGRAIEGSCASTDTPVLSSEEKSGAVHSLMDSLWSYYREAGLDGSFEKVGDYEPIPLKFWKAQGGSVNVESSFRSLGSMGSGSFAAQSCLPTSPPRPSSPVGVRERNTVSRSSFAPSPVTVETPVKKPAHTPPLQRRMPSFSPNPSTCISPDPTRSKRRNPEFTSSKDHAHRPSKRIHVLPEVIGPDSPQMRSIENFFAYLQHLQQHCQTEVSRSDYQTIVEIFSDCREKHVIGNHKFRNLPGAIFERCIGVLGGPAFHRLFNQSKEFANDHRRVKDPGLPEKEASSVKPLPRPVVPLYCPSSLETAVGYGFHLARIYMSQESKSSTGNSTVKEILEEGVATVSRMKDEDRSLFWKYMVESPVYQRQRG